MTEAKPAYLPADANARLKSATEDGECITNRELVGFLMYVVTCTRPDIADAVGNVAKFCEQHTSEHWATAKRILKFLVATQELTLVYYASFRLVQDGRRALRSNVSGSENKQVRENRQKHVMESLLN